MSDSGLRTILADLGIGEEELRDLLVELNNDQPLHVNVYSKKADSGMVLHRRTSMQAMFHLKEMMEEHRGLDEHEAVNAVFETLLELKELRDTKGHDAFREQIGLMNSDQLQEFTRQVQSGEINRSDNLFEYRLAGKTVLDGINEKLVGLSIQIENKREFAEQKSSLDSLIDQTLTNFRRDLSLSNAKMDAEIAAEKTVLDGMKLRTQMRVQSMENMDKILSKGAEMTKKLDRIVEKAIPKLKNKVQAKKVEKYWASEEGKIRQGNMVMQAAMISLHTRRLMGETTRTKVTNQDMEIGKKIFKEYAEQGTLNKAKAFTAVHRARHLASEAVAKKNGNDPSTVVTPSLKRIYASITGAKMSGAEVAKKTSLDDSGLVLDPKVRRDLNKKKAGLKSRPAQNDSNIKTLKVSDKGVNKLRNMIHKKAQKAKLEKITDPVNQEAKELQEPNMQKLRDLQTKVLTDSRFSEKFQEKVQDYKDRRAQEEKREKILEERAEREEALKKELGPEGYEKHLKEEEERNALKQEQNQQQKKDSDDLW